MREQIVRASKLDRKRFFNEEGRCSGKKKDKVPVVVTFLPAFNELKEIVKFAASCQKVAVLNVMLQEGTMISIVILLLILQG